jgi:hypothetical protein
VGVCIKYGKSVNRLSINGKSVKKMMYIPISPFTLDERSNPEADVETLCLDFLYEPHQVISSTEIILRDATFLYIQREKTL